MKKFLIKSAALLLFTGFIVSCEEETTNFDTNNGQSLVGFNEETGSLAVFEEGVHTYGIEVGVTTAKNYDRTINLDLNEELTTALPAEYSIDAATFVIPANQFVGKVMITGNYNVLPALVKKDLVFDLVSVDGQDLVNPDMTRFTLQIFRACPIVRDELLGTYLGTETPGGYQYYVEAVAGEADNEIILSNVWEADANSTTKIFINDDPGNPIVSYPPFAENFLFDDMGGGNNYGKHYVDGNASGVPASKFDPCAQTITLNFKVRVNAGTFATTNLFLVKQ